MQSAKSHATQVTFLLVKEFNKDFVNITVQTLKEGQTMDVGKSKRVAVWETLHPQRLMGKIYGAFKRSHVSGPLYAISFDELVAYMSTDAGVQRLIVQSAQREELSGSWSMGVLGGLLAGGIVLLAIAWGVVEAIAIGILGAILLSKK